MQAAIEALPQMLDTDGGPEWKGAFHAMLERNGVAHRIKSPQDTNALAVCDRKIQQIKTAISQRWIEEGEKDWRTILPDIVRALNETPTEALQGQAPDAIDAVAEFDLQKANAAKAEQSQGDFWKEEQSQQSSYMQQLTEHIDNITLRKICRN